MTDTRRTRRFAALAVAIAAGLVATFVWVPSDASSWSSWTPQAGALFNTPRSTPANEDRLENQVIDAINHARTGSTIRMSMFSFDRVPVANALINAHRKRGVNVQVIVNGHEYPYAQHLLFKDLHQNRTAGSWYYQCRSSCRGQGDVEHSKFILFSATGAAHNVVMIGSLNMKLNGTHNQFNDLLTVRGQNGLYNDLATVFDQMKLDRLANPAYLDEKINAEYELFVLPFPRGSAATAKTRWTKARDPITQLLAPISCKGADTDTGRTIVRVNMHAWSDERGVMLAHEFEELWAKGCDVKIQVGFASKAVRQIFAQSTSRGRMPVRSTGFDTDGDGEIDLYSHQKELEINGHYGTQTNKKLVVTGSSNYQNGGQYGDELILAVSSAKTYNQYAANWKWSWLHHTHGFAVLNGAGIPDADGRVIARKGFNHKVPELYDGLGTNSPQWNDD